MINRLLLITLGFVMVASSSVVSSCESMPKEFSKTSETVSLETFDKKVKSLGYDISGEEPNIVEKELIDLKAMHEKGDEFIWITTSEESFKLLYGSSGWALFKGSCFKGYVDIFAS